MPKTTDVAIIGGGVTGCSIAYHLAKLGIESTLFEKDRLACGASGATAGIVGPLWYIDRSSSATFDLGMKSLTMFPELAVELRESGVDPEFQQEGILRLAFSHKDGQALRERLAWQAELDDGVRWIGPDEVIEREPMVNQEVLGGVFSPHEGCIRGQRYVHSLAHGASRLGAKFIEGTEVVRLESKNGRVTGVRTTTDTFSSVHTVLAAGPWTGIPGRWVPDSLPIRPVKGQRVLVRSTGFLPQSPVSGPSGSAVPQLDGNMLLAATREEGKFDERITAGAVAELVNGASQTFPAMASAEFVAARAGVRPGSPDDVPIMSPVPGWEGLSIASGHDRIGIMLSPGTGDLIARYISTGDSEPLEPFSLARFGVS